MKNIVDSQLNILQIPNWMFNRCIYIYIYIYIYMAIFCTYFTYTRTIKGIQSLKRIHAECESNFSTR